MIKYREKDLQRFEKEGSNNFFPHFYDGVYMYVYMRRTASSSSSSTGDRVRKCVHCLSVVTELTEYIYICARETLFTYLLLKKVIFHIR